MNKLSEIVDYYFDLIGEEPTNYKRHLRPAKNLLCLCNGNVEEACEILDKTKSWVEEFGDEWVIETAVKYFVLKEIK